jgi:hypothetical protein
MTVDQWMGSTGVALLLAGFFMNQFGYLDAGTRSYQWLNAAGAALACYASYLIGFAPFVVLEGVWTAVAVFALMRPAARDPGLPS